MTSADQEQAGSVMVRKTIEQCIDELRRSEHSAGMVANWLEPLAAELTRAREQIRKLELRPCAARCDEHCK